jgi:hypothetical protein
MITDVQDYLQVAQHKVEHVRLNTSLSRREFNLKDQILLEAHTGCVYTGEEESPYGDNDKWSFYRMYNSSITAIIYISRRFIADNSVTPPAEEPSAPLTVTQTMVGTEEALLKSREELRVIHDNHNYIRV